MSAVDKVALSIMKAHEHLQSNEMPVMYDFIAEQAIIAMREPTPQMLEVVDMLPRHHNRLDMWCAMIDVALGRIVKAEETEDEKKCGADDPTGI